MWSQGASKFLLLYYLRIYSASIIYGSSFRYFMEVAKTIYFILASISTIICIFFVRSYVGWKRQIFSKLFRNNCNISKITNSLFIVYFTVSPIVDFFCLWTCWENSFYIWHTCVICKINVKVCQRQTFESDQLQHEECWHRHWQQIKNI